MSKRHGVVLFALFVGIWIFIFIAFHGCAAATAAPITPMPPVTITPVPEPPTYALAGMIGLGFLIFLRHKKR